MVFIYVEKTAVFHTQVSKTEYKIDGHNQKWSKYNSNVSTENNNWQKMAVLTFLKPLNPIHNLQTYNTTSQPYQLNNPPGNFAEQLACAKKLSLNIDKDP